MFHQLYSTYSWIGFVRKTGVVTVQYSAVSFSSLSVVEKDEKQDKNPKYYSIKCSLMASYVATKQKTFYSASLMPVAVLFVVPLR